MTHAHNPFVVIIPPRWCFQVQSQRGLIACAAALRAAVGPSHAGSTVRSLRMSPTEHPRSIRSFVTRAGRITEAQQRALARLWPRYGIEFSSTRLDAFAVYGREAPRTLEIGFGNGENLGALALA